MRRLGPLALAGLVALGCGGLLAPPRVVLSHELTGEEARAAEDLGAQAVNGRFPDEVTADCSAHAAELPWLAGRSEDALVRIAALEACATCAPSLDRGDLEALSTDALDSDVDRVLAAGLHVAGALLADEPAGSPLLARVVELSTSERAEVRYAAIEALDHRAWGQEPELAVPFLHALRADEPWLVTEALRRLRYRAIGLVEPEPFVTACKVLIGDKDPGIRGRAALALVRLAPGDEDTRSLVLGLLDDAHPYARSAAAEALGELGWMPAVHEIVTHLDDRAPNVWEMFPFQHLDGTPEVPRHVGSLFERTDDAMLRALVELTKPLGPDAFVYREVNLRYLALDVIAATRDARKWYTAHADQIPRE